MPKKIIVLAAFFLLSCGLLPSADLAVGFGEYGNEMMEVGRLIDEYRNAKELNAAKAKNILAELDGRIARAMNRFPRYRGMWDLKTWADLAAARYESALANIDAMDELFGAPAEQTIYRCLLLEQLKYPEDRYMGCYRQVVRQYKNRLARPDRPVYMRQADLVNMAAAEIFAGEEAAAEKSFAEAQKEGYEEAMDARSFFLNENGRLDRQKSLRRMLLIEPAPSMP